MFTNDLYYDEVISMFIARGLVHIDKDLQKQLKTNCLRDRIFGNGFKNVLLVREKRERESKQCNQQQMCSYVYTREIIIYILMLQKLTNTCSLCDLFGLCLILSL